jgi:hypothetical protein
LFRTAKKDVDGRVKPGHDEQGAARLQTMLHITERTMQAVLCLMRCPAIDGSTNPLLLSDNTKTTRRAGKPWPKHPK